MIVYTRLSTMLEADTEELQAVMSVLERVKSGYGRVSHQSLWLRFVAEFELEERFSTAVLRGDEQGVPMRREFEAIRDKIPGRPDDQPPDVEGGQRAYMAHKEPSVGDVCHRCLQVGDHCSVRREARVGRGTGRGLVLQDQLGRFVRCGLGPRVQGDEIHIGCAGVLLAWTGLDRKQRTRRPWDLYRSYSMGSPGS